MRVRYAGLNPADLAQRAGSYPAPPGSPPDIPGLEVAGTVENCGERVSSWQPGDRVFGLVGGGGLADRVVVHERCVARRARRARRAGGGGGAGGVHHRARRRVHAGGPAPGRDAARARRWRRSRHRRGSARRRRRARGSWRRSALAHVEEAVAGSRRGGRPRRGLSGQASVASMRRRDPRARRWRRTSPPTSMRSRAAAASSIVSVAGGNEITASSRSRSCRSARRSPGTVLRARPLEEKATAIRAFEREVVPGLASGRLRPIVDSVYPAADVRAAFDRLGSGERSARCCWISRRDDDLDRSGPVPVRARREGFVEPGEREVMGDGGARVGRHRGRRAPAHARTRSGRRGSRRKPG